MEIKGNMKKVEPRKPVVSLGGVRGDLSRILEPIKQNLEILTGRRAGVKELKGLPQATPRKQIISKINELVARLNGSGTVLPEQAQPGDNTDGEYAPLDHTHVKADITDFPNLAMVAYSGSYTDLHDTPVIPDPITVDSALSSTSTNPVQNKVINAALAGKANTSHTHVAGDVSGLATVATSGSYNDLSNKPTIPTVPTNVSAFTNDAGYLTQHQDLSDYVQATDLSAVATSGSYNDLTDTPTIPTVPTNVSAFTNDAGYITSGSLSGYLPLAGGTMDVDTCISLGGTNINGHPFFQWSNNNYQLVDLGYANNYGARLELVGLAHNLDQNLAGGFVLRTDNGTMSKELVGRPDGTLTWDGHSVCLNPHTHAYLSLLGGTMSNGAIIYWGSNSSLRVSGNTTQGMYVGCGTAGTGAGAELALYNQDVGAVGKKGNFELTASTIESSQSGGTVVASVLRGTPDGALTWGGTSISLDGHTHSYNDLSDKPTIPTVPTNVSAFTNDAGYLTSHQSLAGYLPLSGGTMTGGVGYKFGITKWTTTPSSTQYQAPVRMLDGDGTRGFALEVAHYNNAKTLCKLQIDKGAFGGGSGVDMIAIGYDRTAGAVYTVAPTPPASDNSTQIATTAWVTTKAGSYLPLAGGTMTGVISRSGILAQASSGNSSLSLICGDNNFDGASLQMFGRSNSSYAGRFYLRASNKSSSSSTGNSYDLVGYPDGNLNWTGSAIKVNGTEVSLDGHTHSYLPLSGGTMTGNITRSGNLVVNSADNSWVRMNGGTSDANGAFVLLYGKSHSSGAGQFQIRANNGTTNNTLVGYADGQLTWGGSSHALAVGLGEHTFSNVGAWGYITSSSTSLVFYFPIIVVGSSVSISTLTASVRVGSGGYTSPGGATAESLIPSGVTKAVVIASNMMRVTLTKSAGWGATNNTTVCLQISSFKFTVS